MIPAEFTFNRWRHETVQKNESAVAGETPVSANIPKSCFDVARALGDAASTVKRFYVRMLEPGVEKKWFNAHAEGRESH